MSGPGDPPGKVTHSAGSAWAMIVGGVGVVAIALMVLFCPDLGDGRFLFVPVAAIGGRLLTVGVHRLPSRRAADRRVGPGAERPVQLGGWDPDRRPEDPPGDGPPRL